MTKDANSRIAREHKLDRSQWRQRKTTQFLARQRKPIRFHATTNLCYGRPRKETKPIRFSKSDSAKGFGSWFGQGKSKQATHLPIFSSHLRLSPKTQDLWFTFPTTIYNPQTVHKSRVARKQSLDSKERYRQAPLPFFFDSNSRYPNDSRLHNKVRQPPTTWQARQRHDNNTKQNFLSRKTRGNNCGLTWTDCICLNRIFLTQKHDKTDSDLRGQIEDNTDRI